MSGIIHDAKAEKLEAAGLWRRAATRWLEVMYRPEYKAAQQEWVRQRRKYCLSRVTLAPELDKLRLGSIVRAAADTLARMGPDSTKRLIYEKVERKR